ncbi:MAG TPA: AAA family ATPase [Amnibacterium sp.]|nr:AAA family ATPase [Amnibacterium sp.]
MSRFLLVTADTDFELRVTRAVTGGLSGRLRVVRTASLPDSPGALLVPGPEPTELVLLGPGVSTEDALRLAAAFDVQHPAIAVVLVGVADPELALAAMRAGVRDILDPAADPESIRVLLERALAAAAGRRRDPSAVAPVEEGRIIVVASPKGGVGKTTLAANIAVALGRIAPMSTVLVDLDAQFGDVASALRLEPEHSLADAVGGAAGLDSMVLKTFLSVHHSSIYALCAPADPAEADRISGEDVGHVLEQLAREFRYVVVDTAPGLGEHALAALERATETVLICTMDVPSVRGLREEIEVIDRLGLGSGRRSVAVNLADRGTGLSIRDIEATIRTPVDVVIPRSRDVAYSTNRGVPLLQEKNRGRAAKALRTLAGRFDPAATAPGKGAHKRAVAP